MILADTSIWIDHLRKPDKRLLDVMNARQLLVHPFVTGELALGGHRVSMVLLLQNITSAVRASDDEVLQLIRTHRLSGSGIGYVDVHLVTSTLLTPGSRLWTRDQKLHDVAERLGIAA